MSSFHRIALVLALCFAASWAVASAKPLEDYAFKYNKGFKNGEGFRTDAVLVWHDGKVVYEKYDRGFDTGLHRLWSSGKVLVNILTGIAVRKNLLQLDQSVCDYLEMPRGRSHCDVTLRHLLEWRSGLQWIEWPKKHEVSSLLELLFGEGQPDMLSFILGHPKRGPAGSVWCYTTSEPMLLMAVLEKVFKDPRFPWTELFNVMGIKDVTIERDGKGRYVTSHVFMKATEFAKIGQLMLNDGVWNGVRLLPEGWVAYSTQVVEAYKKNPFAIADYKEPAGAYWWINQAVPEQEIAQPWPEAPADAYAGIGYLGQHLIVIPSKNAVIVRFGEDRDLANMLDRGRFIKLALEDL